ncbi:MAG TPA: DNA alkylation repair protein [Candidatus Limnocylindria bacterium]|nr:DNA alkylation repair protein [Candidatus Limnocylindria bacterium]
MTAQEILNEIKPLGSDGYRKILSNHGVPDPCYGVKIEELKKIQKRVKVNYRLALDLYDTGVYDAMYLAGLVADDAKMTPENLQHWADKACIPLARSTVSWVAAGSPHGLSMAQKWIDSPKELVAVAGWATFGSLISIKPDTELDLPFIKKLLQRIQKTIRQLPNDVRRQMNSFLIEVGTYVVPLNPLAIETAEKLGPISVDVGNTACQIPFAPEYIKKVEKRGSLGKKRKTVKC